MKWGKGSVLQRSNTLAEKFFGSLPGKSSAEFLAQQSAMFEGFITVRTGLNQGI